MLNNTLCNVTFTQVKTQLSRLLHENGMLDDINLDEVLDDDMIESGLIDSVGAVCLQDQIKTYFNTAISLDQFIGECHTLNKLIQYLALKEQGISTS